MQTRLRQRGIARMVSSEGNKEMSSSALYTGRVRHHRHTPVDHAFEYRQDMLLIDLDELPQIFDRHPLFSARRWALARFDRADYLGDAHRPLHACVRELVYERTGQQLNGPIRLLTTLRHFGHNFNPVCFFYCFSPGGARVDAVVAQVTNTPWGECHAYVLGHQDEEPILQGSMPKVLHVSPFMAMDNYYHWRMTEPGRELVVHMEEYDQSGQAIFDVHLNLQRQPLTLMRMTIILLRFPLISLRTLLLIYWNALRLKCKRVPIFPHPKKSCPVQRSTPRREATLPGS